MAGTAYLSLLLIHRDIFVEHLDVCEPLVLKPTKYLRVRVLRLVQGRDAFLYFRLK